ARAVIGLERVVRSPVGLVTVVAVLDMRVAAVGRRRIVGDGTGDDRTRGKGSKREPQVAMAAVASAIMIIAAVSAPVTPFATRPIIEMARAVTILPIDAGVGMTTTSVHNRYDLR